MEYNEVSVIYILGGVNTKKCIVEDWEFQIIVTKAERCRMGFEVGDKFICKYECPSGFCPKTMPILHTLCEIARCGGDYKLRGSKLSNEIDFPCTDGCIEFHLVAKYLDV